MQPLTNLVRESKNFFVVSMLIAILVKVVLGKMKSPLLYIQVLFAVLIALLTCSSVFEITFLLIAANKLLSGIKYWGQFLSIKHFL